MCLWFCLGQGEQDDSRGTQTDDGIHNEEQDIGTGDQQSCDGGRNDHSQVEDHAY